MKVALYVRVSTDGQDPEVQLMALRAHAAQRGWQVVEEFVDRGVSGARERRPALDRLLKAAWAGRFQVVLVWRFDRFARSVKHLVGALETFRSLNVGFVSLQEQLDTATPIGQAMFTVIGAMAQLERDIIRERVKAGLERAKARGIRLGRPRIPVVADDLVARGPGARRASPSARWPGGFAVATPPCAATCPRRCPTPRPTRTVTPERRPPRPSGPLRGPRRSVSRPAIDRLLPPDLQSRPLVVDWLVFLADLLAAEAIRDFADRGSIE